MLSTCTLKAVKVERWEWVRWCCLPVHTCTLKAVASVSVFTRALEATNWVGAGGRRVTPGLITSTLINVSHTHSQTYNSHHVSHYTVLIRSFMCNYCMQHVAVITGFPTCWKDCNYCSVLHAIIAHEATALLTLLFVFCVCIEAICQYIALMHYCCDYYCHFSYASHCAV